MPQTQSKPERKPFNEPKPMPPLSEKDIARFWSKVDKTPGQGPKGDCWGWTGGKDKNGYGKFSVKVAERAHHLRAHRVGHFLQNGVDTAPNCTLHSCDFPPCVRDEHLSAGSPADNSKDRDTKGRTAKGDRQGLRVHPERAPRGLRNGAYTHPESRRYGKLNARHMHPETTARGERSGTSKLTEQNVIEIRTLYATGAFTQKELGVRFGVIENHVYKILKRELWTHI